MEPGQMKARIQPNKGKTGTKEMRREVSKMLLLVIPKKTGLV